MKVRTLKEKGIILLLACLFLVSSVLIGCSSNEASPDSEGSSSPDSDGTSTMPDRPFVYLSQLVVETMDPARFTDEVSMQAIINTYDPLIYPKLGEKTMDPGAHIAKEWEVSEDGKTYTFTLQEGITFHSGNELTAEDVVFSMQRMLAIQQGYSWLWNNVLSAENVKAIDERTVEMTLNSAYAPFIATLTQLFIVDSETVLNHLEDGPFGEFGDYGQKYLEGNTAGSGPYVVDRWERGSEMRLKQFPDYWMGWKEGQIEEVRFLTVAEEATVKTMLASGEADLVNQWLSIRTFDDLKEVNGVVVQEDPSVQLYHLPMNIQKPPFDDINVRKAVLYAFDYTVANEQILNGATQAQGPVPILTPGHNPDVLVYNRDLEKAKEYLANSKYAGQELEVEFMFISEFPEHRQISLLLQNNLAEIGINVNLNASTWTQITEAATTVETTPHLMVISDSLKYPHLDSHTYGIYHPSAHGSYRSTSWYDNPEVTALLEQAREAVEVEEQMRLYGEAQKLIAEDSVSIYIANPNHRIAYRDYVEGYTFVGLLGYDTAFYHLSVRK